MLTFLKKLIPQKLFKRLQPYYHLFIGALAALVYRWPSRKINVVAVTGTKGKSSTVEILSALLEAGGHRTAMASTVKFKIGDKSFRNKLKMSMPGRFFLQKFLRQAVKAGCDYAIIEMTSEGAKINRHRFIHLAGFIFTNLSPEHLESHGSYEKYRQAKLSIAQALARSPKSGKILVANGDDPEAKHFLAIPVANKISFHLSEAKPFELSDHGINFTWRGQTLRARLRGEFNLYNILGALAYADSQGITADQAQQALDRLDGIPGRAEFVSSRSIEQDFDVVVDYAHTPDSLKKIYQTFPQQKKICLLGGTGGGRDRWKRPAMGEIADFYCQHIILTNEDPYDEDPDEILNDIAAGIKETPVEKILDRRQAIARAIRLATTDNVVIITGKGSDPCIMGPKNTQIPWDDVGVAREELAKFIASKRIS